MPPVHKANLLPSSLIFQIYKTQFILSPSSSSYPSPLSQIRHRRLATSNYFFLSFIAKSRRSTCESISTTLILILHLYPPQPNHLSLSPQKTNTNNLPPKKMKLLATILPLFISLTLAIPIISSSSSSTSSPTANVEKRQNGTFSFPLFLYTIIPSIPFPLFTHRAEQRIPQIIN